jgi:anti-sigma B factor antagonist
VAVITFREDRPAGGTCVLAVEGEVDLAVVDELLERARGCLSRDAALELDMQGVSFIDSSGLGALVRLRQDANQARKRLTLVNVSQATDRLLEVTGLHTAFDIRPITA